VALQVQRKTAHPTILRVGSNPTHENQDEEDDQDDADDADATVTVAVAVTAEPAAEAAQQEDDEDDDKNQSQRHCLISFDRTSYRVNAEIDLMRSAVELHSNRPFCASAQRHRDGSGMSALKNGGPRTVCVFGIGVSTRQGYHYKPRGDFHSSKTMWLILLLIVLVLLFGGGGFYVGPPYHYYGGGLSLILIIVILVLVFRG